MSGAEALSARSLALPGVAHAFFTRRGGVSVGLYHSLNGGVGSRDESSAVGANRERMASALAIAPERLSIPYQVHSPDVVTLDAPFAPEARPRCDALVTATPGLGLGVTGADCGMILFADPEARVIGACHAGWKGALTGVIEATVTAMTGLQARAPERDHAALGPCIAQSSYEVGPEFVAAFASGDRDCERFFIPSRDPGRSMFDLHAYIAERARRAGVGRVRGSRTRHLRRRSALFQLPPRHPSQGGRLRAFPVAAIAIHLSCSRPSDCTDAIPQTETQMSLSIPSCTPRQSSRSTRSAPFSRCSSARCSSFAKR